MTRLRSGMTGPAAIRALAGDSLAATKALRASYGALGADFDAFCAVIDSKELYGVRIGMLFDLCDQSAQRFIYHVEVELPNQKTGAWSMASVHFPMCDSPSFKEARHRKVRPNMFWALKAHPPINTDYDFPIL